MTVDTFIDLALAEDIGLGDVTAEACLQKPCTGTAKIIAKENGVISGLHYAEIILKKLDPDSKIWLRFEDGDTVNRGDCVLQMQAEGKALLSAERLILNILQRMSGIATYTRYLQSLIGHTKAILLDTRKTTPLFRIFEKEAVLHGGAQNHRMGLYDMILIKENHIELSGGIEQALLKSKQYRLTQNPDLKIEIELKNLEEVKQVLICGMANRLMLDNFTLEDLRAAVKLIQGKYETEASGGVNEHSIRAIAETGVDYISVGALTHSVKSMDLSMLVDLK